MLTCTAIVTVALSVGCDDRTVHTDPATQPTVGERVDRGISQTGETLGRAADRAGDVIGPAVDDAWDRAQAAGETVRAGAQDLAADLAGGVHHTLADITEAAMTRSGMNDLAGHLSEADRPRFVNIDEQAFPQLDAEVARFRELWRSKYGRDFDIDDPQAIFNFVTIRGDAARNDRATVIFPARGGMSELAVPMVREGTAWRVDVPEAITPQQFADNLISGLRPLNAGQPPLPDDMVEAYRSSAHGTLAALLGESRTDAAPPR